MRVDLTIPHKVAAKGRYGASAGSRGDGPERFATTLG